MRGPNGTMMIFVIAIMVAVSYGPRLFERSTLPNTTNPITTSPIFTPKPQSPPENTRQDIQPAPLSSAQKAQTSTALAELPVKSSASMQGYSREQFPHWNKTVGPCDGRENALKRYGTDVKSSGCTVKSGTWYDPYSGQIYKNPGDLDADHVVSLAEAWRSGAQEWSRAKRERFANDDALVVLMTQNSLNRSKGDKDPSTWKPPLRSYWPRYAQRWIAIKKEYGLTIDAAEKSALQAMLNS